jgi:hypothetical protein
MVVLTTPTTHLKGQVSMYLAVYGNADGSATMVTLYATSDHAATSQALAGKPVNTSLRYVARVVAN